MADISDRLGASKVAPDAPEPQGRGMTRRGPDEFVADLVARKQTKAATLFALNELRVEQEHDDRLEAIAKEIEALQATAILHIAERLAEAREIFRYRRDEGGFSGWVERLLPFSLDTAYNLLHVHERFGGQSSELFERFAPTVLYALAAPGAPESATTEVRDRAATGEKISVAKTKEAVKRHKRAKASSAAKIEQEQLAAVCRDASFSEPDGESFPAKSTAAAHATQRSILQIWEGGDPAECGLIRDVVLDEFFRAATGDDICARIPEDRLPDARGAVVARLDQAAGASNAVNDAVNDGAAAFISERGIKTP